MDIKEQIISRFDKSKFELLNCETAPDGDWDGVDEYIREFIRELNNCELISTLYSCEGHKEDDSAYLFFNVNEAGWDIFWQKVMPELSNRFCTIHPEIPDALFQTEWLVNATSNEHNAGINIHTTLGNFSVKETGRVIATWEQKKERFWSIIKEIFLKYYK
jgi:hypothetical protein